MSSPLWMLQRLSLETASHHPGADEDRLALMEARSLGEYRSFLVRVYGFEASVEQALMRVRPLDDEMLRERCKAGRLRQDLSALGMNVRDIATIPLATIRVDTPSEALGWLFVVERHTLVAGLLQRHVERAFGITAASAVTYLGSYGVRPGSRMRALGEAISAVANRHVPNQIVAAAHDAFRAQRHWYRTRGAGSAKDAAASDGPARAARIALTPQR